MSTNDPRPPSADAIASFVRLSRGFSGWKQEALAHAAGVSLSTLQRVERGEVVSRAALERIGAALDQPPGALTAPRVPLSEAEGVSLMVERWGWMADCEVVPVAPLRTQRQLREFAECVVSFVDDDLGPEAEDELAGFREWLDLLGFVRAEHAGLIGGGDPRQLKLRQLYRDVLDACAAIERAHGAVCLMGVYRPEFNAAAFKGAQAGVVAFRSRRRNPAAGERRTLLAPKAVDLRAAWDAFVQEDDR